MGPPSSFLQVFGQNERPMSGLPTGPETRLYHIGAAMGTVKPGISAVCSPEIAGGVCVFFTMIAAKYGRTRAPQR
jgi:hypothetical protein